MNTSRLRQLESRLTPQAPLRILATSDDWQALSRPRWLDVTADAEQGYITSSSAPEALSPELQSRLLDADDLRTLDEAGVAFITMHYGAWPPERARAHSDA